MDMMAAAMSELNINLWASPGTRYRQHPNPVISKIPAVDDLVDIAEAFVGAYVISQGGFFSAWKFLLGLQHHHDEEDKPVACENAVLGHLPFCIEKKFKGKTQSYIELQEVGEDGDKILRVAYSDALNRWRCEYRRSGPNRKFPEERREAGGKWRCLDYSHRDHTFNSLSETLPSEKYPLPNKVSSGMSGEPIASLVTIKAYTSIASSSWSQTLSPPTPAYLQLLERREGELWVKYTDHGWFMYLRAINGYLGLEHKVHTSKHKAQTSKITTGRFITSSQLYAQNLKTLKSCILDMPLPNKVAEWIHFGKCLAWIVRPKICVIEAGQIIDHDSEVSVSEERQVVMCLYNKGSISRCFEYLVYFKSHGPAGVVLMEREITDAAGPMEEEELTYSQEMKTWLSPALTESRSFQRLHPKLWRDGVPLPTQVVEWLKQNVQKVYQGKLPITKTPQAASNHLLRS
jgi:hypothetical protein